ncbi:hypothetical protein [Spongiactinospora sp. 9N601]|uniref:hypothetical protein n=1 Tax=Spongiactinospora sp. 9N601 TaxID=3375149 RepID=UPI003790F2F5
MAVDTGFIGRWFGFCAAGGGFSPGFGCCRSASRAAADRYGAGQIGSCLVFAADIGSIGCRLGAAATGGGFSPQFDAWPGSTPPRVITDVGLIWRWLAPYVASDGTSGSWFTATVWVGFIGRQPIPLVTASGFGLGHGPVRPVVSFRGGSTGRPSGTFSSADGICRWCGARPRKP